MITNVIAVRVKFPLFLSHCNENSILSTDFRKVLKDKCNENLTSGSRGVPRGPTDRLTWQAKLLFETLRTRLNIQRISVCMIQ